MSNLAFEVLVVFDVVGSYELILSESRNSQEVQVEALPNL